VTEGLAKMFVTEGLAKKFVTEGLAKFTVLSTKGTKGFW
jgi:hypothetical protein